MTLLPEHKTGRFRMGVAATMFALAGLGAPALAEEFDLDALIAAAQAEDGITIYSSTSKIKEAAAEFTKLYGIEAVGTKVKGAAQIDLVVREHQAGNVVGDVIISSDAAAALAQLLPEGMVTSWTPPDMADTIDELSKDPLVVWRDPSLWTYNNEDGGECPVSNIWEVTEEAWNRRITMEDPLNKPSFVDWFNQMQTHFDDEIAAAFEDRYGEKLDTSAQSATATWVERLAANAPLLTDSSSGAAEAIGTRGQEKPFFGLVASAKFRDVSDEGLAMAICKDLNPYMGFAKPGFGLIAAGTDSPNAAKLFLHFMMTDAGVLPMTIDGKMSGNSAVPPHPEEISGVVQMADRLTPHVAATGADDFDRRQDWQDFWRIHYSR
ncbi:ABC transporter substrate-binding protein [Oceanibium sediminis]|uniref:ABC transporter substrate-binding protein n=1 Tax=Oceanibium sediminis TaxID=2026339 RepID=UPI000DD3C25E|nr:substrate-binding domain-containing protein [Oceanibium sediminis]